MRHPRNGTPEAGGQDPMGTETPAARRLLLVHAEAADHAALAAARAIRRMERAVPDLRNAVGAVVVERSAPLASGSTGRSIDGPLRHLGIGVAGCGGITGNGPSVADGGLHQLDRPVPRLTVRANEHVDRARDCVVIEIGLERRPRGEVACVVGSTGRTGERVLAGGSAHVGRRSPQGCDASGSGNRYPCSSRMRLR